MKIITIITTKNRPAFFEKAFRSVLSQSRKSDEIIVVSDSTNENYDKELSIVGESAKLIKDKYTHNYAGSLNTAIHSFISDTLFNYNDYENIYIATLDDDDTWDKDYLFECEKSITNNQDFVVSGLVYCNETGDNNLSIPHELCIDSFLAGNPHIQGSNTFIKLSTLLKAGMFDENLPSTTDRDLFVRVMMLNPAYAVVDKYLVYVNAYNDRQRITNGSEKKADGLKKFFYKYSCLMSDDIKDSFFKRAEDLFSIRRRSITHLNSKIISYNYVTAENKYDGKLIIGFIATDYDLGLRLLKQLCALRRDKTRIVILINFEQSLNEYAKILEDSGYNYDFITHDRIVNKVHKIGNFYCAEESLQSPIIKDIAVARSILQLYLYELSEDGDVIWVLDEDMELMQLAETDKGITEIPLDIDNEIAKYIKDYDAVIGQYSLDAPLPTLSIIKCALLDYMYHTLGFSNSKSTLETIADYYYDFSDKTRRHLETPISYNENINIDAVFSGKALTRPLYLENNEIAEARSRGGNTLIFNRALLKIPNWSLQIKDKIGRRSDYFWVLEAKSKGYTIVSVPFATLHNRSHSTFDIEKELNKLLLDLIGSSFTKSCEVIGMNADKNIFYDEYKQFFINRLSNFTTSFYRIIGLLQVIGQEKYASLFSHSALSSFIKTAEEYTAFDAVCNAYSELCRRLDMQEKMQSKDEIEEWIKTTYKTEQLTPLGNGGEGVVFTDNKIVYKHFFDKPKRWELLVNIAQEFGNCNELYEITQQCVEGHYLVTYSFQNSLPFEFENYKDFRGKIHEQLADLIAFCKNAGIVFTNIKRENFIIVDRQLKLIDYGKSFEAFNENDYNKMIDRAYEMIRYPKLSETDFKQLIQLYYLGRTKPHDSGVELFKSLIEKRYKEDIHDGLIRALVRKYTPEKILDYGAGKCKIANALCTDFSVSVFDIDLQTINSRADKKLAVYKTSDEIPKSTFDVVISNLVLCCVDNDIAESVVGNITKALAPDGHAIISICNPFFNNVQHTELRTSGLSGSYYWSSVYEKANNYGAAKRVEYHRPIEYYINLLKRYGLTIQESYETDGINIDTLNPIGEHLVFDCKFTSSVELSNTSLLIKANPMEADCIYENIRHIVSILENGIRFFERIVVADCATLSNRARRYAPDNLAKLKAELQRAKDNGLIDRIEYAPTAKQSISKTYKKYFGIEATNSHSKNGQALFATLHGYESIKTKYVFQTDSDILYHIQDKEQILTSISELDKGAITVTLSVPQQSCGKALGCRTEVRSSFLNLEKVEELLPIPNKKENGVLSYPWHRSLDAVLSDNDSVRLKDKNSWFLHPENCLKSDKNFLQKVRYSVEKGIVPIEQYGQVNVTGHKTSWVFPHKREAVVYIRGRNTPCEKLKRLFDSLKKQNNQSFDIVYVDDASDNGCEEYAKFVFVHDPYFANRVYPIFNRTRIGELANIVYVMQNVITDPNAIVINVDSDDYLVDSDAIDIIINEFNNGAELTVGNCIRHDKPLKNYKVYSFDRVWERAGDNIWLHPKCFRRILFDAVDVDHDLKLDGKFVEVNTDFAFMLPMISSTDKCKFIDKILYYFEPSEENQSSNGKYNVLYKNKIKERLLNRQREKHKPKIMMDTLEFLNSSIDEIFDKDKLYIDNGEDLDQFKITFSNVFFEMESMFRKVFQSDISFNNEDINSYAFGNIFVSIKNLFGNKYFSLLDKKGKPVSVNGCVYMTWLLDRIRNLVSHAVIGWDLKQKFTMDKDFIQCLPVLSNALKYEKNHVLTVAGMIVSVLAFCKYETITYFSEYFSKHWGYAVFNEINVQKNAYDFFCFFKDNFSNNYCGVLNECFNKDSLTLSTFYHIKDALFHRYSKNVAVAVTNRETLFFLKVADITLPGGVDISGSVRTIESTLDTCLEVNEKSHWGNFTFHNTYRLFIDNVEFFCDLAKSAPLFSIVSFLYTNRIYKTSELSAEHITRILQLDVADCSDNDKMKLALTKDVSEEANFKAQEKLNSFAKFNLSYKLLRGIFSQQADKLSIMTKNGLVEFSIDLAKKTVYSNFKCKGYLIEKSNVLILKINKGSYWDGVVFLTDYELAITNPQQFVKHSSKLPPLYLVLVAYLSKCKTDNRIYDRISKIMNKNTLKFYSECGINDLLLPRTESQLQMARKARMDLMKMFYEFEQSIITWECMDVDKYLKMSEVLKQINCPTALAKKVNALRNFCAHAYSIKDYLRSEKSWYCITNEFILDTLNGLADYLSININQANHYENYLQPITACYEKLIELFGENI